MKSTTRVVLTASALAALLCACQSESEKNPAPAKAARAEAPSPHAGAPAAPAALEATAPAPRATASAADEPAPCVAPAAMEPAPAAIVAEKRVAAPDAQSAAALTEGPEVGQRIPSYKNTVHRPGAGSSEGQAFDTHATTKPTLYIANSTTCPYCTVYIDRMKAIETAYIAKGVDVVHVYPVREQTAEAKAEHHAAKGFQGGMIADQDAAFAKALDIHKTPTAILADASGRIVYRGRIDDNANAQKVHVHELADAIDAALAGRPVQVATTEPFG
jgi:peroxiredoxin